MLTILLLIGSVPVSSEQLSLDLADPANRPLWIAHPSVGEASYDAFVRDTQNPVYTGVSPDLWPVNGFYFQPAQGPPVIYVGLYGAGYAKPWQMMAINRNKSGHWHQQGLTCPYNRTLYGIAHGCPDGSAVDDGHDGAHMVFDWSTSLGGSSDNGLGYQHCTTPIGPCVVDPVPVNRMINNSVIPPGYLTTYGGTLIKRESDWIVLTAMSTRGNAGGTWALAVLIAAKPEGIYSPPKLLLYPQSLKFHPHPCEFYPCFSSDGYAYCPCTGLQANRGFQALYRANLSTAEYEDSWELYQLGSFYHWDGSQHEAMGIWGQTFSGSVDSSGTLNVMYPSRNNDGVGTINVASRPFNSPFQRGFWVSAPNADSVAVLPITLSAFVLKAIVKPLTVGDGWTLRWNYRGELGPDSLQVAGAVPSVWTLANNTALCFDNRGAFSLVQLGLPGSNPTFIVRGETVAMSLSIIVEQSELGEILVWLNGSLAVNTTIATSALGGGIVIHATKGVALSIEELNISYASTSSPQRWIWLTASDGIAGAASAPFVKWNPLQASIFRHGQGFVSSSGNNTVTLVKYNFIGTAAKLWLPKGPDFGIVDASVDGTQLQRLNLRADIETQSSPVYEWTESPNRSDNHHQHALIVQWVSGAIPVDGMQYYPVTRVR